MVRLPNHGEIWYGSQKDGKAALGKTVEVKVEVEDHLEEEHGPLGKRNKLDSTLEQKVGAGAGMVSSEALHYNLLNEPSPLGLRLRKSPSLLDLIQMRLSQAHSATTTCLASTGNLEAGRRNDLKPTSGSAAGDKLKASNFPASLLRIGTWECVSRYEGDLVAKCYYAKHKLVWEVLESGLKSKIEIQWSDITALKANCPENGPSTLDIVLSRRPLFFKETNPQPRKHTLWQATSDFTGGQASIHRRHFLQCPQGLLSKHFEKLIQCDPRLNSLSHQPEIILESPYFELRCSIFEDHQDDSSGHTFNNLNNSLKPTFSGFPEAASGSDAPTASCNSKSRVPVARKPDHVAREIPSRSSDSRLHGGNASSGMEQIQNLHCWDQLKVAALKPSMSVKDLADHLEHCISEQMNSGNPVSLPRKDVWEELKQHLLNDTQVSSISDELSLMSRVNSLCCLLQKDGNAVNNQQWNNSFESQDDVKPCLVPGSSPEGKSIFDAPTSEVDQDVASQCMQQGFSRKESFGELLLHIPRIASLPQFLFNISDDSENQAR